MFLDKRHFPGTLFDRATPLSGKDDTSPCRPSTAKTGEEFRLYTPNTIPCAAERGENLVYWLSKFGHRCPNLASGVHSWPFLASFGQSCPRGVIVHPSGGPPRTAMGVEVRKFSAKSARATDPAGHVAVRDRCSGRSGSRHETHAPQFPRSRQRGRRLAQVGAARQWPPVRYAGGRLDFQRTNARAEYPGVARIVLALPRFGCDSFNPDGAPAQRVAATASERKLGRRWLPVKRRGRDLHTDTRKGHLSQRALYPTIRKEFRPHSRAA
jgi:hypothetical protein